MPTKPRVNINNNNIYLLADVYQTFFSNLETIILLKEQDNIIIMPIQGSIYGGLMLKTINNKGDKVINAYDFFRHHSLSDLSDSYSVSWDQHKMGLSIHLKP